MTFFAVAGFMAVILLIIGYVLFNYFKQYFHYKHLNNQFRELAIESRAIEDIPSRVQRGISDASWRIKRDELLDQSRKLLNQLNQDS